jgi:hypothetical protein
LEDDVLLIVLFRVPPFMETPIYILNGVLNQRPYHWASSSIDKALELFHRLQSGVPGVPGVPVSDF